MIKIISIKTQDVSHLRNHSNLVFRYIKVQPLHLRHGFDKSQPISLCLSYTKLAYSSPLSEWQFSVYVEVNRLNSVGSMTNYIATGAGNSGYKIPLSVSVYIAVSPMIYFYLPITFYV